MRRLSAIALNCRGIYSDKISMETIANNKPDALSCGQAGKTGQPAITDPISQAFLAARQLISSQSAEAPAAQSSHHDVTQSASQPAGSVERRRAGRRESDGAESPEGIAVVDRRSGLDRRRGPGRRRSEDRRTAEEGEMNDDQLEFIMAINEYKKVNRRPFPTWTEILDVAKALGYRKVAKKADIA
jgi:hypothetical protein